MNSSGIDPSAKTWWPTNVVLLHLNRLCNGVHNPLAAASLRKEALHTMVHHVQLRLDREPVAAKLNAPCCRLLVHLQELQKMVGYFDSIVSANPIAQAVHGRDGSVQGLGALLLSLGKEIISKCGPNRKKCSKLDFFHGCCADKKQLPRGCCCQCAQQWNARPGSPSTSAW